MLNEHSMKAYLDFGRHVCSINRIMKLQAKDKFSLQQPDKMDNSIWVWNFIRYLTLTISGGQILYKYFLEDGLV